MRFLRLEAKRAAGVSQDDAGTKVPWLQILGLSLSILDYKILDGMDLYVFSAQGAVIESHEFPADLPNKCCFAGPGLDTLYVTTGGGHLYGAKTDRRGL